MTANRKGQQNAQRYQGCVLCGGAMNRKRTPLRTPVFGFAGGQVLIEFGVESAARIGGELESLSIPNQLQNISCAIEDRTAMVAILEVGSHDGAKLAIYGVIQIVRYLPPNFFTVDFDGPSCQVILRSGNVSSSCVAQFRRDELSGTPDLSSRHRRSPAPER